MHIGDNINIKLYIYLLPAKGGPTNEPRPSKMSKKPQPIARFSSPKNSIIIEGNKGPPTAEMNPKITLDKITAEKKS